MKTKKPKANVENVAILLKESLAFLKTELRGLAVRDQDGELYVLRARKTVSKRPGKPRIIVGPVTLHSEMGCGAWFVVQDPRFIDKDGMWSFNGSYKLTSAESMAILYGPRHPLVVSHTVAEGDTVLSGDILRRRVYLDRGLTLPDVEGVSFTSFLNMCTAEDGLYVARIVTHEKPELLYSAEKPD